MAIAITKEDIENYLEKEKCSLLRALSRDYDWTTPKKLIEETISQNFGVIMFFSERCEDSVCADEDAITINFLDVLWSEYHEFYKGLLKKY